ncbi:unnamed protein product [Moneuplotes crassus]|uniref:Uncharacterized protein n=1 Tax=Euplotes crassus TaxID=5936 RepID=A0AAD1U9D2_EUPCR|nr:unnamed protein product [Moneuplotes crassus]
MKSLRRCCRRMLGIRKSSFIPKRRRKRDHNCQLFKQCLRSIPDCGNFEKNKINLFLNKDLLKESARNVQRISRPRLSSLIIQMI